MFRVRPGLLRVRLVIDRRLVNVVVRVRGGGGGVVRYVEGVQGVQCGDGELHEDRQQRRRKRAPRPGDVEWPPGVPHQSP